MLFQGTCSHVGCYTSKSGSLSGEYPGFNCITLVCVYMYIVDIKDSLFFKVDSYSWYFLYQGKCWSETKAGNYIYVGVSNTSSMHYVSEGMVEASGSAPSGKQGTGILIID